jgi:probable HAF family extracellular repeat protein
VVGRTRTAHWFDASPGKEKWRYDAPKPPRLKRIQLNTKTFIKRSKEMKHALAVTLGLAVLVSMPVYAEDTTAYNFETINFPDDTFTQLLGINNADRIAGYHGATVNKGFTYSLTHKTFTDENFPGSAQTQVIGINNNSKTDGFFIDTAGNTYGFTDSAGTFLKVAYPGTPFNQLLSQNDFGQAAGYYSTKADGTGPDFAYVYDEFGSVFELLNIPRSTSAQATGINDSGDVCGFFVNAKGVNHAFLLSRGLFQVLNFPASTGTQALGLNNKGQVVGLYTDSSNNTHGFVYITSTKTFQSIDDPNGVGTTIVNGINDKGILVGFFGTAPINSGFVAAPSK